MKTIGIINETKNIYERRTPLTPDAVKRIVSMGHKVVVQPSTIRIFTDKEYKDAGAEIKHDLTGCDIIFAVKEIPEDEIVPGALHIFFSHTIKGQEYNMPLLSAFLEKKAAILDYETLVNAKGRRLVFFGKYAGLAGMVDSLHYLGQKMAWHNHDTPLMQIKRALSYDSVEEAKTHIKSIGEQLMTEPFSPRLGPLTILVAGYGNVGKGCFEILDCLPIDYVQPEELAELKQTFQPGRIYVSILKEKHMVCRKDNGGFDLQEYFAQPELYESINDSYLEFGHLYMNTIYWSPANPTFVSKKRVHELYASGLQRPLVVGDITCDIEGSVEFNIRATDPGNPIYTWDPIKDEYNEGYDEPGVTVLAVDNLPCEFPRDSSGFFCDQLMQLSEELLALDVNNLGENVPEVLNNALICHSGKLTEKYEYLKEYLN